MLSVEIGNVKSGMGLQNLCFRAKKIEGTVEIKSDSDGSKILIYLNHAKEDKNPDRR